MRFSDVVGQDEVKNVLLAQTRAGRLPHALMLCGDTGYGTLALALALATYVMCENKVEQELPASGQDSCGRCPACVKMDKLIHADLHFSFPVIKKSSGTTTSDTYLREWQTQVSGDKYFDLGDWLRVIGTDKKQAVIPDDEADSIIHKLSLSAYEGGWKVMIIWLPEKMNQSAANTLLKTLEEPAPKTLFILCSEHPELLLETIVSRTQRIDVPPLSMETIRDALMKRRGLDQDAATGVARVAGGSWLKALKLLCDDGEEQEMLGNFMQLMRLAYVRDLPALMKWSEKMAALTRDGQKMQLAYMQHMLRESFMYNFSREELNFLTAREADFTYKFARFVNERNVIRFYNEFSHAQRAVESNVNGRTIFFNLALQVVILLRS